MKNLILAIISSLLFNLSAMAYSTYVSNEKKVIAQEETKKKKKKIDITVEKSACTNRNLKKSLTNLMSR